MTLLETPEASIVWSKLRYCNKEETVAMLIDVFSFYVTLSTTSGFVSLGALGLFVICDPIHLVF